MPRVALATWEREGLGLRAQCSHDLLLDKGGVRPRRAAPFAVWTWCKLVGERTAVGTASCLPSRRALAPQCRTEGVGAVVLHGELLFAVVGSRWSRGRQCNFR